MPSISEDLKKNAEAQLGNLSIPIYEAFNQCIGTNLSPFKIGPATISDPTSSHTFSSVVYEADSDPTSINPNNAFIVTECQETLTALTLQTALDNISKAKSFDRSQNKKCPEDPKNLLGIIFARKTELELEEIAELFKAHTQNVPSHLWPDMIAIHGIGTISFSLQFPGEKLNGDYMIANLGDAEYLPAFYVVCVIRPIKDMTFNKVLAFMCARFVMIDMRFSNFNMFLEGMSPYAISLPGYQYNLQGNLCLVPPSQYNDRMAPELPLVIQDEKGSSLGAVRFLPWQDGGVILLEGEFPLQALLIWLPVCIPSINRKCIGQMNREHLQISHVLPINRGQFIGLLRIFEQRTNNIFVKKHPTKFIIQKVSDEGSSSPFVARMMAGIYKTRDSAFFEGPEKEEFDRLYGLVKDGLHHCRQSAAEISRMWQDHSDKINSGDAVEIQDQGIRIKESIDVPLKKEFESFVVTSSRTLKTHMQNLTLHLGENIGFLFKKETTFDKGIADLKKTSPDLAAYLENARIWTEPLILLRNDFIEHGSWSLPRIEYPERGDSVLAIEPEINGEKLSDFCNRIFNQLILFGEEVTAHLLQQKMIPPITIREIPLHKRDPKIPERFKTSALIPGMDVWTIKSHNGLFEET